MASRKPRSVWTLLERLGHPLRGGDKGDREQTIQHVFEAVGSLTIPSPGDGPLRGGDPALHDGGCAFDGDAFLVEVFEALGTSKTWPACGSAEWARLREVALLRVVARLAREGLLDAIAVGRATDVKDGEHDACASDGTDARDTYAEGGKKIPAAKGDGSASDSIDGDMAQAAKDENPNPRIGVQVGRALLRRCQRNPKGWFRCVDRITPYRVLVRWAKETCPGASAESLAALMDGLREVRWWDDDGHVIGAEMLAVLEAEIAEGCGDEQWMLVVSDFEAAVRRLRDVFERLCLL